ncbi:MAG: hypothetical protein M1819_006965 [Sarea resinae]|nr:MAG: hypothetical protein M1819_006965 [Sarea resinae]
MPTDDYHDKSEDVRSQEPSSTGTSVAEYVFPEGGTKAWLVVAGCFCVQLFTFGYVNAFGVYQAYYAQTFLRDKTASDIAWIGSIQFFFQFSAGSLSGPVTDRYGPRVTICSSSALYVASLMLTSLCKEYYQYLLCQGILAGITNGLVYTPAVSIIGQYFHRRRALAMGIASTGSSLGGVIFPVMLIRMLFHTSIGFGWSVRVVGFLVLGLVLVAALTVIPRIAPRHGPLILYRAFEDPAYSFQVAGLSFVFLGLMTPMFYLPSYSRQHGMSQDLSFYTLAILNATSLFGRLLSGYFAQGLGRFNLVIFSSAVAAILCFCLMRINTSAAIIVFAALYGLPSGSIVAMLPTVVALVTPEPNQIGTYIGMALGVASIAGLVGTPITGALISHYGGYDQALIFSGVVMIFGASLILRARFSFAKPGEIFV